MSPNCGYLINLNPLMKIVECSLISTYIKDEKPVSLLIAAKPESGKSTVMKLYRHNKGVVYLTDVTAYGLQQNYLNKIKNGEVKTIMIPDLITPLSKQTKTRNSLIAFLNSLIEEGVVNIATGFMVRTESLEVKANMITAVTEGVLEDKRRQWEKMGFISRFILFTFSYSDSSVYAIMKRYSESGIEEKGKFPKKKVKLPRGMVDIDLSVEIADRLDPIALRIGEQYNLYGFRAKVNFRCLLKCLAYRNSRKAVTEAEFREFMELADFMNFNYKPI